MLRDMSDVHRGSCGQLALAGGAEGEARGGRGLGREGQRSRSGERGGELSSQPATWPSTQLSAPSLWPTYHGEPLDRWLQDPAIARKPPWLLGILEGV